MALHPVLRSSASVSRREALSIALAGLCSLGPTSACAAPRGVDWRSFKQAFVNPDGRVLDTGGGGVSHSEGQGYGMLFAVEGRDRSGFDAIWGWTQRTLKRPDGLLSWRYTPGVGVSDPNNATDGDILVAWALLLAAKRWRAPDYQQAGLTLMKAMAERLLVARNSTLLLLPGADGFRFPDGSMLLNPSYYVFPALDEMQRAEPGGPWEKIIGDGLQVLQEARFGVWALPPDWLRLEASGSFSLPASHPPRFSYDAIRAPLYLAWSGRTREPLVDSVREWWTKGAKIDGMPPAWIDLVTAEAAPYPVNVGASAVVSLITKQINRKQGSALTDYYDAALWNLARLAARA